MDVSDNNCTCCIKSYTVAGDSKIINTTDISVDYNGGKYFYVNEGSADGHAVAGACVKFNINGKTYAAKTNAKGIAQKAL